MKKWIIFAICIIASVLALRACGIIIRSSKNSQDISTPKTEVSTADNSIPTIEETVICDDLIAKVTINGLSYNRTYDTYVVNTNIENKTTETMAYSVSYVKVNSFTLNALAFGDIYSGMNADAGIAFSVDEIKLAEIKPISSIKFSIELRSDTSGDILEVVDVDLKTSEYGTNCTEVNFVGTEVYNKEGIIVKLAPSKNPTIYSPLTVFVENNSERNIILAYNDIAFNDKMAISMFSGPFVLANTKRIAEMELFYFDKEPEVDEIKSVSLSLSIQPYREDGSFTTADMVKTEQITIDCQQ